MRILKGILITEFVFLLILVTTKAQTSLAFVRAINGFSTRFYQEVASTIGQNNIFISGFSISTAFSFLSAGARGNTQNEIVKALGFSSQTNAETLFKPAIAKLKNIQGVTLKLANKVYIQSTPGLTLSTKFKNTAVNVFKSDIETIDFSASTQAVANINSWIGDNTDKKVTQVLTAANIDASTKLVLVNAMYFKGLWDTKFDPTLTHQAMFYITPNHLTNVEMMQRTGLFGFLEKTDWDANVIEMNYVGKAASMVIILPNRIDGLAALEKNVANSNLRIDVFNKIKEKNIDFSIPSFKIETTVDLEVAMPKLGIKSIFGAGGDLTGLLSTKEQLFVSTAIHKGFFEINEEGTEATSSTVITASKAAPPSYICDRSFMYFIKLATGEILFSGRFIGIRYVDPTSITSRNSNSPFTTTPTPMKKSKLNNCDDNYLDSWPYYCKKRMYPTVNTTPEPALS